MLIEVMDDEVKGSNLEFLVSAEELAELDAFDLEEPSDNNLGEQCKNEKLSKWNQQEETAKPRSSDQCSKRRKNASNDPQKKKRSSTASKKNLKLYSSSTIAAEPVHYKNPACIDHERKEVSKLLEQAKIKIKGRLKDFEKLASIKDISKSNEIGENLIYPKKIADQKNAVNDKTSDVPTASAVHPIKSSGDVPGSFDLYPPGDLEWKEPLKEGSDYSTKNGGGNASSTLTPVVTEQFSNYASNSNSEHGSSVPQGQHTMSSAQDPRGLLMYSQENHLGYGYNQNYAYHNPDQYSYDNSSYGYPSSTYDPSNNYYGPNNPGYDEGYGYYSNNAPQAQNTTEMTHRAHSNQPAAGCNNFVSHAWSTAEMTPGTPSIPPTAHMAENSSIDFKAVTHPLLPSAQLPVVQAFHVAAPASHSATANIVMSCLSAVKQLTDEPLQPVESVLLSELSCNHEEGVLNKFVQQEPESFLASSSLSKNEQALLKKSLKLANFDESINVSADQSSKKPKGEISIEVRNIHPEVNLSGFKKVLQAFGRMPGFAIHKRAADAPSSSLTATFANIEGASRALRVLSKLSIGNLKVTAKYEGDMNYHKSLTKLEQSRDKDLKATITRLLNHEDPMRPVRFDPDEISADKIAVLVKTKATITKDGNPNSSSDSCSLPDNYKPTRGYSVCEYNRSSQQSSRSQKEMDQTNQRSSARRQSSGTKQQSNRSRTPDRKSRSVQNKTPETSKRANRSRTPDRHRRSQQTHTHEKGHRSNRSRTPIQLYRTSKPERRSNRSKSREKRSRSNRSETPQKNLNKSHERWSRSNRSKTPQKNSSCKFGNKNIETKPDSVPENNMEKCLTQHMHEKIEKISPKDRSHSQKRAVSSAPPVKTANLMANVHSPVLDGYNICIDGGLKKLSKIAVHEISNIFGGVIDPVYHKVWHLSIPNHRKAQLLLEVLHGQRLLDDRLQVSFGDGTVVNEEFTPDEILLWRQATASALELHDSAISQLLATNLDESLDIFRFKLEPCQEVCCGNAVCNKFHGAKDRRRDPRLHFYRPLKCPEGWQGRLCPRGEDCELCHSETELQLHADTFRATLCPKEACKEQHCPYAHKESPELFFHSLWKDLFIKGLHNTLYFVAGALRNLCKLDDDAITGLQILAVTSSANVAHRVTDLLQDTALRHGVKVTAIVTGGEDPSGAHALFGTAEGLLMLLDKRGTLPLIGLCALIVDDASYLLQEKSHTVTLLRLLQLIKDVHKDVGRLNKVLIGQDVPMKGVSFLENFLSTTFTVVGMTEGSTASKTVATTNVASSEVRLPSGQSNLSMNPLGEILRIEKPKNEKAEHEASDVLVPNTKQDHSVNSTKKERVEDHSQRLEDGSKTTLAALDPPAKRFKNSASASEVPRDKSLEQLTPLQYRAEEKALREELDDIYSAFIDVPEMHPNYSIKYNEFLKTRGATGSVSEAEWAEYWRLELELMKKIELADKKKPIIAKYKQMLASKTSARFIASSEPASTKVDDIVPSVSSHSHAPADRDTLVSDPKVTTAYSALDSFGVLEGVADHIGLLGAALKGLIDLSRNAGSTTKKAFNILLQEDNITLMNMCISKMKRELDHATPSFSHQLNQGVAHAEKLLKLAAEEVTKCEKIVPNNGDFGLALQAIAKATEGQSSSYIVNFIKCSLDLQGAVYDKKDLNELFLAVSAIHFDMSVNADPQSLNCVAPESKSSRIHELSNTNPIPPENVPSSIQQAKNMTDSQFTTLHQDQDSNKNSQYVQNSQIASGERFNLNLHSQFGAVHKPHSESPSIKYPDELKINISRSRELQESSKNMKLRTERSSEPSMSMMPDASGKIDLEKLLNCGTSKDVLKNILEKIPSKSNSQPLTQERGTNKYNSATKSQLLSYQASHQISEILLQASTATAEHRFGKGNSYSSYPGAADSPKFDTMDDVSRHNVTTDDSSGPYNSRENVARDRSDYAESYDHSALPSDDNLQQYFTKKCVYNDEINWSTSSSSNSLRQCTSQAERYAPYSVDDSQQHLPYQSSTRAESSTTSSQQRPTFNSVTQSTEYETSTLQHPAYSSGSQSTKHETSSPQYPTYGPSRQPSKPERKAQPQATYNSLMQSARRETNALQHATYNSDTQSTRPKTNPQQSATYSGMQSTRPETNAKHQATHDSGMHSTRPETNEDQATHSGMQSNRHETNAQRQVIYHSGMQSTRHETNAQIQAIHLSEMQSTRPKKYTQQQAIYHSEMQSARPETNTQQQATYYSGAQTERHPSCTQHYLVCPPDSHSTNQSNVQQSPETRLSPQAHLQSTSSALGSQQPLAHPIGLNFKSSSQQRLPDRAGKQASSSTAVGLEDVSKSDTSSWFINKVKNIVNLSNLSLSKFNRELAIILKDKPADYKFSKSDLLIVKELQTLGSLNVSEALFISTLKGKFL